MFETLCLYYYDSDVIVRFLLDIRFSNTEHPKDVILSRNGNSQHGNQIWFVHCLFLLSSPYYPWVEGYDTFYTILGEFSGDH